MYIYIHMYCVAYINRLLIIQCFVYTLKIACYVHARYSMFGMHRSYRM